MSRHGDRQIARALRREAHDQNIVGLGFGAFQIAQQLHNDGMSLDAQNIEREGGVMRGELGAVVKARLGTQQEPTSQAIWRNAHGFSDETINCVALVEALRHQTVEDERQAGRGIAAQYIAVQRVEGWRGRR